MGMMELNWAAYEPEEGEFDEDYERQMEDRYAQLHAAGLPVTLGLGLHYTPGWVTEIPNSHFVDEDGNISDVVNLVFNSAVRAKAAAFIARIDQGLGLDHFQAIRIASGGRSELLYPGGGHYWGLYGDSHPRRLGPGRSSRCFLDGRRIR